MIFLSLSGTFVMLLLYNILNWLFFFWFQNSFTNSRNNCSILFIQPRPKDDLIKLPAGDNLYLQHVSLFSLVLVLLTKSMSISLTFGEGNCILILIALFFLLLFLQILFFMCKNGWEKKNELSIIKEVAPQKKRVQFV